VDNEATAEDLVTQVFIEVWLDAAKFDGRSHVARHERRFRCCARSCHRQEQRSAIRRSDEGDRGEADRADPP
jgi:hypothetical protein